VVCGLRLEELSPVEFTPFPKIPRLYRDIVVTEKIDGTNAAVVVKQFPFGHHAVVPPPLNAKLVFSPLGDNDGFPTHEYLVGAQSRKRVITPESDNFGFATWVFLNAESLVASLGEGVHFGEWWGAGIQRRYGLDHKRFSLFNTERYAPLLDANPVENVYVVPELYRGPFDQEEIDQSIEHLRTWGSLSAPGYMNPEGIVVYHTASRQAFKVTLDDDGVPKSLAC
jgi:hypothetical protein